MNTKIKTISYRKIMFLSMFVFSVMLLGYIVLMNAIVSTSKTLTQLEDSIIKTQTQIMKIEQDMLVQKRGIDRENAQLEGFVESSEIAYIKVSEVKTAFLNE